MDPDVAALNRAAVEMVALALVARRQPPTLVAPSMFDRVMDEVDVRLLCMVLAGLAAGFEDVRAAEGGHSLLEPWALRLAAC